jgi:hypothetical protein
MAAAGRFGGIAGDAGDCRAFRVGNRRKRRTGRKIYAKRRLTIARQPDAVRGQAAVAVGRSVLARLGRSPVSRGGHHAAHRAAPQNLPGARRRGARQSVLRSQHPHAREFRRGVLPARRVGVRHHGFHVFFNGQGRVDLRHQPCDERLRRRAGDPPSGARLRGRVRARHQRAGDQRRRRPRRASERCWTCTRSSANSRASARLSTVRISRWLATSSTDARCIRS